MLKFLKYISQLLLSPGNGWEDISHAGIDTKILSSAGLFPLIGLAAMSSFIKLVFDASVEVVSIIQVAIIVFVQLVSTYYIASAIFGVVLSRLVEGEPNEKKYNTVIIYSVAIISLIKILENCIPFPLPLLYFLYIYVALIIWKSVRYLAVKEKLVGYFMLLAIVVIIIMPFVLNFLLTSITL